MENIFYKKRLLMVKNQIENRGIRDKKIIKVMQEIPRHLFVLENNKNEAYEDYPLSIGYNQTISQPYIVALMTELLNLTGTEKILEIGMGSGYQTAVLAKLSKWVYSVDIKEDLVKRADKILNELGINNYNSKFDNGYLGWEEYAPFDAVLTACAAEEIPENLIKQLKENGKMIIPIKSFFNYQDLVLVEKKKGKIKTTNHGAVVFVPMINKI